MGRPLNKKYFGNRNIGADGTYASGSTLSSGAEIGGEGVASVAAGSVGSAIQINNTYKTFPVAAIGSPSLANGITATISPVWEIDTVSLSGGSTYTAGNITSLSGLTTQATVAPIFSVTVSGGVPSFKNFTDAGTTRGEFTSINGNGITTWAVIGPGGNGAAQATITFRLKRIDVLTAGSGYDVAPSITWSGNASGTTPSSQTVTLTVDTGAVGSATNKENAIKAYAYTGGSLVEVDIQKQISTKRYRVNKSGETARTGTEVARIRYDAVADGTAGYTAAQGVELNIIAQDTDGKTYLVRKLWNRTCTVMPVAIGSTPGTLFGLGGAKSAGTQFAANQKVKWTFGAATSDTVTILNA